jgi:NAD(P)H-flavin reductase
LAETVTLAYTKAVITDVRPETPDTFTLSFELGDGRRPADFLPGQFNMLYVQGAGEVPISIASSTSEVTLKHTIKSVGSVTGLICGMKKGDAIGLRGPYGAHWPVEKCYGSDLLVITGGCGLPPVRPVIMEAMTHPERFKSVGIFYGARTPKDLIYKGEYEVWGKSQGTKLYVTVDKAEDDWPRTLGVAGRPTCETSVGVVSALLQKVGSIPQGAKAFVCGPEVMMKFTVLELLKMGMAPTDIYVSLERNMTCGRGTCGHCQIGPYFICRDGPVFNYSKVRRFFAKEGV